MNNYKKTISFGLLTLSSSFIFSNSANAVEFMDQVTVVSSVPAFSETEQPRQECWTEYINETVPVQQRAEGRSVAGSLIGTIAGGIIGNQVGGGAGRAAATGIGMMIGGVVGDKISANQSENQPRTTYITQQRPIQKCKTFKNSQRAMDGYDVTFSYNGKQFTERMPYDPGVGRAIPVNVKIGVGRITF